MIALHDKIKIYITRFCHVSGPIILSAFSLFISFILLQPIACWLDPTFNLLANRGTGKIAFTVLVLLHIGLLITTTSNKFLKTIAQTNVYFLCNTRWIPLFLKYFAVFCGLHAFLLLMLSATPFVQLDLTASTLILHKVGNLAWGFIATFFLAWTEEFIFRGTLFTFFNQHLSTLGSVFVTSAIFSLVHNVTNPLALVTTDWKLGLGLFLLGVVLNLFFVRTKTLATGMGVHAGLVFVKVFLRRIPMLNYAAVLPWWLDIDLRQSPLVHLLFLLLILYLLITTKNLSKQRSVLTS